MRKSKSTQSKLIGGLFWAVIVLIAGIVYLNSGANASYNYPIAHLDNEWKTKDGETFSSTTLKPKEVLTLTWQIPEYEVPAPTLEFNTQYTAYEIWLDDELIDSYRQQEGQEDRALARKVVFVELPWDCMGKTITLKLTGTVSHSFNCHSFFYSGAEDLWKYYFQVRRMPVYTGLFLITIGCIMMLTIPLVKSIYENNRSIFFHGPLLFTLGLYILCYNQSIAFLIPNNSLNVYVEHLALYFIPFFMQGTLSADEIRSKQSAVIFLAIDFAFPLSSLALSVSGTTYITEVVYVAHLLIVIQSIEFIVKLIRGLRNFGIDESDRFLYNGKSASITVIAGMVAVIISGILEIVFWYLPGIFGIQSGTSFRGVILMVGSLFLVACMVASYFYYMVAARNEEKIKEELSGLAYTDDLTDLSNRSYCQQQMEILHRKKQSCTVISYDLDGLKQTNDILGHQTGDHMLGVFASVLTEVFPDALFNGRMGGDEFITVLDGEDRDQCDLLIKDLEEKIRQKNEKLRDFYLKVSWGVAYISEVEDFNLTDCYMLADERMYRMKRAHKEGRP